MGSTLQFTCTCNTGIHEEEENTEEEFDIFKIDSVKVYNEKEGQSTYDAETETMDGVCRPFFLTSTKFLRLYTLFYNQRLFFNSTSVLLNFFMNWASNVAWVLLNTYGHRYTDIGFIFGIFVSIPKPRSIYVVFLWFIFSLIFHCHLSYNFM